MAEASKVFGFTGKYQFLSNFWRHPILFDGDEYPSVEHAFQAAKTNDPDERQIVREQMSPGRAKRCGHRVTLRADWEKVKVDVMRRLVREKFKDQTLKQKLLDTGDVELVEWNTWGDTFWGVCTLIRQGQNRLGKILMEVRKELQK